MLINSTLSVAQPSSPSLVASTSAPWTPRVTKTHRMLRRRTNNIPKRLSTCRVRCEKAGGTGYNMAVVAPTEVTVKAIVTVQRTIGGILANVPIDRDDFADWFGRTLLLELVSAELDPKTGEEWAPISSYAGESGRKEGEIQYEAKFKVPIGFGEVGAIRVENEHRKEMFVKNIVLVTNNDEESKVTFICDSWVHSKSDNPEMRIFFSTKSYLPSKTPKGLARLRSQDLQSVRGDGTGERKTSERIYDYDVYNDLGNPDNEDGDQARPVLGGSKEFPYPRRCRTGRPRTKNGKLNASTGWTSILSHRGVTRGGPHVTLCERMDVHLVDDPHSEKRSASVYVPRDEAFSEVKLLTFGVKTLRSVLHSVVPSVETSIYDHRLGFPYFTAIDSLYDEGVMLPEQTGLSFFRTLVPRIIKAVRDTRENVLLFETPEMIDRDKFSWFRDEEFARQTLAGLNPFSIKLLTELPIRSKLDPDIYGPADSLITPELIEREIKGAMTAQQAIEQKKLFILDYHDMFLPYVHKVRELEDTTLYGSRTVFFLTHEGTLMPIAIELTRPASPLKPQWRQVYTDDWDATSAWLWKLAKVHVCAHDSGYHQLVSHWLRTHCCTEPYIIATNRQLSAMHPIYRLLHPHFRYTMEINALAREFLISADGIIESSFWPGKYSMELSSVAYGLEWRFDMEALPADLIRRGMAVEDPNAEHGLRLTIEDYPYANDGLLIWASIKEWVTDYVNYYYETPKDISDDSELQEWWLEIRTKGHADKKDEPWWPKLESRDDLVHILTIIIWVTSGHHAAVNFGQYHYAGYFPNRPTIARTNMPDEDKGEAYKNFMSKPEMALMRCFPSQVQATKVMAILDVLSSHSPDEEYMGDKPEIVWEAEPAVKAAFERFNGRMKEIEGKIDQRNLDENRLNRCGAGIVPYELLKPFSGPGVTGKGIPNSISI